MNATKTVSFKLSRAAVLAAATGALGAASLFAATAGAQWVPPPPEIVATTEPVYFEGHAAYWYGNHWYWHDDHGGWNHYEHEPPALAERRAHIPPRRSWEHRR